MKYVHIILGVIGCLALAGCSSGGSTAPPPSLPAFRGAIPPSAAWELQYGDATPPAATHDGQGGWYFDFPECLFATECSVHYVATLLRVNLTGAQSITLNYEI